ncbi:hypothetical protein [uncultured Pseudokineococcus sp.]|uniref:hypothetical protein n=1 Tax=uncultured Pseudokineococcus sp. TaxID=1642928 RepID=UPI002639C67A|nr:hypothetical protein [uncultured Pseudokineococcus sp.]
MAPGCLDVEMLAVERVGGRSSAWATSGDEDETAAAVEFSAIDPPRDVRWEMDAHACRAHF